jgi:hypothetical protein
VARLTCSGYRSLLLIEGPEVTSIPVVHPHSLEGALVSIAAMWRVPMLHSADAEQSARELHFLADQVRGSQVRVLRRYCQALVPPSRSSPRQPRVHARVGRLAAVAIAVLTLAGNIKGAPARCARVVAVMCR